MLLDSPVSFDFLLAHARRSPSRSTEANAASATEQEFLALLVRRADPSVPRVAVAGDDRPLTTELADAVRKFTDTVPVTPALGALRSMPAATSGRTAPATSPRRTRIVARSPTRYGPRCTTSAPPNWRPAPTAACCSARYRATASGAPTRTAWAVGPCAPPSNSAWRSATRRRPPTSACAAAPSATRTPTPRTAATSQPRPRAPWCRWAAWRRRRPLPGTAPPSRNILGPIRYWPCCCRSTAPRSASCWSSRWAVAFGGPLSAASRVTPAWPSRSTAARGAKVPSSTLRAPECPASPVWCTPRWTACVPRLGQPQLTYGTRELGFIRSIVRG